MRRTTIRRCTTTTILRSLASLSEPPLFPLTRCFFSLRFFFIFHMSIPYIVVIPITGSVPKQFKLNNRTNIYNSLISRNEAINGSVGRTNDIIQIVVIEMRRSLWNFLLLSPFNIGFRTINKRRNTKRVTWRRLENSRTFNEKKIIFRRQSMYAPCFRNSSSLVPVLANETSYLLDDIILM